MVDVRNKCETSINQEKFKEMQERYKLLLSQASDSDKEDTSRENSISSRSSAASRKRRAELRLRQLREKQEAERRSEEARRERELQTARHEMELAEVEEEEANNGRRDLSLPDASATDDRVRDYVKDLPFNENGGKYCDNVTPSRISVQDIHGLPKPELIKFNGNPADYCKFLSNFESNIEARVSDNRLRLNYLIQLCQGDARYCIEDCVILSPDEGYLRAKEILKSRYGKPHLVARSHVDSLINGNAIKSNDVKGLINLSLHMEKCHITLSQLGFMSDVNNTENLRKIVRRLPLHIRSKWVERASSLIEQGFEPSFDHLLTFVRERSIVANTMYGYDLANESGKQTVNSPRNSHMNPSQRNKVVTLSTGSDKRNTGKPPSDKYPRGRLSCIYCKKAHKLRECAEFRLIDIDSKLTVIREHEMCENCMNFRHVAENCRTNSCCEVSGCTGKHNTMFHRDLGQNREYKNAPDKYVAASESRCKQNQVSLRIVPVVVGTKSAQVETYALLDEGSDVTLCSDSLVKRLGVESKPCKFTLTTVNKSSQNMNGREVQLQVSALNGGQVIDLQKVWSVKSLPISLQSLPDQSVTGKWKHLSGVHLPKIDVDKVELLVGSDTPDAFWVEEQRRGKTGEPYAIRSILGWSIIGPTRNGSSQDHGRTNFQLASSTQLQIDKLWTTDFPDVKSCGTGMSQEDRRALSVMKGTVVKENDHYKLGLPWRDPGVSLPNNVKMATVRLSHLKKKLQRDNRLFDMYKETVNGYIEKGYASLLDSKAGFESGRIWYLPHHPVLNPKKPDKVRVVFDCAAKYQGTSLNDNLLQGPDLTNSITGVLMRFRQAPVALVADIEAMFHQVKVCEHDRDALRFLWWPQGNLQVEPNQYRMNVHLFGATSSPSCAAFCLKLTANDNIDKFSREAVSTVERNFYVDDLLKSVLDSSSGIRLTAELKELLSLGGFRLTKWLSNCEHVMNSIPEADRAKSREKLDLDNEPSCERTLGLQWYVKQDQFAFDINLHDKGKTRRSILSVASSLYDPLGLVAPVTLIPKLILQRACRLNLGWDEQIPDADAENWSQWLASLPALSKVSISRCVIPSELDRSTLRAELHMFSDASEYAYGSSAYLKVYDANGHSKCSLIIGKSRLAPIKAMSIPRLELAAAVVAVKLYQIIVEELDIQISERYFWTDSMIVLGYIRNETKRFKTFVANRLSIIHEMTSPHDWRYVPSKSNPADIASRGIDPQEYEKLETWLVGPEFLKRNKAEWPVQVSNVVLHEDDIELKPQACVLNTQGKCNSIMSALLNKFSDWRKLKNAVGWLLRFKEFLVEKFLRKRRNLGDRVSSRSLSVREIQTAQIAIFKLVQAETFENDIRELKVERRVSSSSSLKRLCPVLKDDVLRVGGRVGMSDLHVDAKHQIILPSSCHVTRILIQKCHEQNAHMGPVHILSLLRQKYWIIHGLQTVKSVLGQCITCKRQLQRPEVQQMSNLPEERLTPDKAPFTYVGVDYFGPMTVKSGRRHLKRYGCLFTCLTTRAVHIEIAHSLDTDSFICALQRFVSRRGNPEKIFSDNGTNFLSGERVLRENIRQFNQSGLAKFCQQQEIDWHFNPPYASHMGGVWERLVRSTKRALKSVIREQLLNDEALLTLVAEVEKILNDRPITQVSSDQRDPEPLSPNKLLIMRPNASFPPGLFDKHDVYCKRWWRQVQYLANVFWRRWVREYLPTLQVRQKWYNLQRNVSVNDLVLVCDEQLSRGKWPLGLVLEVNKGRDGLVRSCKVRVNGSVKLRPITMLCVLEQETVHAN